MCVCACVLARVFERERFVCAMRQTRTAIIAIAILCVRLGHLSGQETTSRPASVSVVASESSEEDELARGGRVPEIGGVVKVESVLDVRKQTDGQAATTREVQVETSTAEKSLKENLVEGKSSELLGQARNVREEPTSEAQVETSEAQVEKSTTEKSLKENPVDLSTDKVDLTTRSVETSTDGEMLQHETTTTNVEDVIRSLDVSGRAILDPISPERTTDNSLTEPPISTEECPTDSTLPCVTKCCPMGQSIDSEHKCSNSMKRFIPKFTILVSGIENDPNDTNYNASIANVTEVRKSYNLITNNICPNNRYRLEPYKEGADEFNLLFNGSLWLPERKPHILLSSQYCMDVFDIGSEEIMLPLICFSSEPNQASSFHFIVYPIGLLISVPFLLATFFVYTMIPQLRTLHGRSLACYVLCLMIAYIFLAVVQLAGADLTDELCVGVAFVIQFSFIACFFWLNVLCFDTWRNVFFHGELAHRLSKSKERRYFVFYSIYAWSFTLIFIIVTMVMKFKPTIPSSYLKPPTFGVDKCWFSTQKEAIPYFYGPIGILILSNVILFIMTSTKLVYEHRRKEILCLRTPNQTFQLCLTLFFMMGINWVMELIAWASGGPNFIWYITDICNTLQGIFIFIVFVMEESVRRLCKIMLLPRLKSLVPCCKTQFQPHDSSSQVGTVNGRANTYVFSEMRQDDEETQNYNK